MKPLGKGSLYNLPDLYSIMLTFVIYDVEDILHTGLYFEGPYELNSTNWGEVL